MKFDELADRASRAATENAAETHRPAIGMVRGSRRRRTAGFAVVGAFVATIVVVGVVAFLPAGIPPADPATSIAEPPTVSTTTPTTPTTTAPTTTAPSTSVPSTTVAGPPPFSGAVWSVSHDPTWHRGNSDLMPNLGWESVTVASFPLRPGGTQCAQLPENALRDLGVGDALVTAFFSGPAEPDARPWPQGGFNDDVFGETPGVDAHECAERPELEVHWGYWANNGEGIYLLAAFGAEITDERRAAAWAVLSSLTARDQGDGGRNCVVTAPSPPGLEVPDTHPAMPVFGLWYGTTDLWTVLEADGTYGPRKSVWWSANFPGGAVEERPEISVVWRRLDSLEPERASDRGTNALTAEDGWFMISGIDPAESGCWEITASYKGANLSYVALIDR